MNIEWFSMIVIQYSSSSIDFRLQDHKSYDTVTIIYDFKVNVKLYVLLLQLIL